MRDATGSFPVRCKALVVALLAGMGLLAAIVAPPDLLRLSPAQHLLMELINIIIAAMVVIVSWNGLSTDPGGSDKLLVGGFTIVAICNLFHALNYPGLPPLLAPGSLAATIFFSQMERSFEVLTLALLAIGWAMPGRHSYWTAASVVTAAALVGWGSYRIETYPVTFIPGQGFTPFKIGYEYGLSLLNMGVAALFWRRAEASGQSRDYLLALSSVTIGLADILFTRYVNPQDFQNLAGHGYKLTAYAMIFRATFITSIRAPFDWMHTSKRRVQDSEERWKFALDGAGVGVWDVNLLTHECVRSRRYQEIIGHPAVEFHASHNGWIEDIHPKDVAAVLAALENCWTQNPPAYTVEYRTRCRDGSYKWVRSRGTVVHWTAAGQPRRMVGTLTDISERRQMDDEVERYRAHLEQMVDERTQELSAAKEEAEAATAAKSRFLANMSHEIRTPLNAVVGLTDLLANSALNRRQREYTEKIKLSAQALRALIDDVLDFATIESGGLQLKPAPLSLNDLLRTAAAVLSVGTRDKPVEVVLDVSPTLPDHLIGDALRLQQILLNLISNAIKFTDRGEIVVSVQCLAVKASAVTLQFAVRDSGIGIGEEQRARIFEVFTQADSSSSRRYGGSGLGLAISARLTALMGGYIEVDSAPDQGSTFSFSVRFDRADAQPLVNVTDPMTGLRVLVVDDHPDARQSLSQACTAFGWTATAVDSGPAAVAELQRSLAEGRDHDVMLLDWHMPGMDGLATLRQARATPGVGLPLVILMAPAFELAQAAAAGEDLHLDGIVSKPLTPLKLHDAVRRACHGEAVEYTQQQPILNDQRLAGLRLLVAEDNELNQLVVEEILTRAGAEVVLADNGRAAVAALQAPGAMPFDAVLMDIQMPVMDGHAATRVIREELGLVELPIIAVTAHALPEEREASLRAGMVGHIVKPFDIDDLLDLILREHTRSEAPPAPARVSAGALPGLDIEAGLSMFQGHRATYGKLLRQFIQTHQHDAAVARQLFEAGDPTGAAGVFHQLGGAARFLRAVDVARIAADSEQALRHGQTATLPALLDALQAAMDALEGSIQQFALETEACD